MPTIKLTFLNPVNSSLQAKPVGVQSGTTLGAWDKIYFVTISAGVQVGAVKLIGDCILISANRKIIDVLTESNIPLPNAGDYIFFGKSSATNTPGLIGYYADVEMINDSKNEAELFSIGSDVVESSK